MEPLQIAQKLKSIFPDHVHSVEEFREQISVTVSRDKIIEICKYLHKEPELSFDFLVDLCGVDHLGKKRVRFEVVYHLYSMKHKERLRLKAPVPEDDCRIASVMPVWIGANWHERECYDLFGIVFEGHPDLRRILLPEDWEGYPLRKDYPLKGPAPDHEWKGFKEVLELSRKTREFEWEK